MINHEEKTNTSIIRLGKRTHLQLDQIVWLEADINYTKIHYSNGKQIVVPCNLGRIEQKLDCSKNFIRPNRGTLVNLAFLGGFDDNHIMVKNKKIAYSRRRKEAIYRILTSSFGKKNQQN